MASARVLVTGGAGFISSHLTEALLREGARVRILDDFSSGKDENIRHVRQDVQVVQGDVRDGDAVRWAMAGIEAVFHMAAVASVRRSIDDPIETIVRERLGYEPRINLRDGLARTLAG